MLIKTRELQLYLELERHFIMLRRYESDKVSLEMWSDQLYLLLKMIPKIFKEVTSDIEVTADDNVTWQFFFSCKCGDVYI